MNHTTDPSDLLAQPRHNSNDSLVPTGYAEKAMASLLQLHSELMEEKERRVDLYRRLMEKEQAIAELKMYVKLLEEKVQTKPAPEPERVAPPPLPVQLSRPAQVAQPVQAASPVQVSQPSRPQPLPRVQSAPIPGPAFGKSRPPKFEDGWKSW